MMHEGCSSVVNDHFGCGVAYGPCAVHVAALFSQNHYKHWGELESLRRADDVPGAMAALWGILVYPPQLGVGVGVGSKRL